MTSSEPGHKAPSQCCPPARLARAVHPTSRRETAIILIAVLFGLAMDYEVFLVSSMREAWTRTHQARLAVIQGARQASRVVTAAALIMFCVFASFVTMEDGIIKPIALPWRSACSWTRSLSA